MELASQIWEVVAGVATLAGLDPQTLLVALATVGWSVSRLMGTTVRTGTHGLKYSFGRAVAVLAPGFHPLLPGLQAVVHAPTRSRTLDLPPQRVRTVDGLVFEVDANVTFRVDDLRAALVEVNDVDRALLDRLAVCVHQVVERADRGSLADLRGFDRALHERLSAAVVAWGVTIEQVGFTSVSPTGPSVRVTQLRALVWERLSALRRLEEVGVPRPTALALLGARTRYLARTRVVRWSELARRAERQALRPRPPRVPFDPARAALDVRTLLVGAALVGMLFSLLAALCTGLVATWPDP